MSDIDLTLGGTCAGTGNEIFGIDLGTTYSAIAWLDQNGKPEALNNTEGEATTPSVVYFESESSISVGNTAKEAIATDPERVVSFIKREMSNASYSFEADGKSYNPIAVSGIILKKLVQDAEIITGSPVKNVIITCPAYFGTEEHRATKEAGIAAGLNVLMVLNEPTAAAYAYGINVDEPQTIMVYDLGGGTFDVTIIRVDPNSDPHVNVVVSGGDSTLGGKDWDEAFVNLISEKWKEATGLDNDILEDSQYKAELLVVAEKNKKFLTTRNSVRIRVSPPDLQSANVEITREEFEVATLDLLNRTIYAANDVISQAAEKEGVDNFEFDTLLCVGGSTLMPQVVSRLELEYGKTPKLSDPHECVAKGAAVYAGLYLGDYVGRDLDDDNETEPPPPPLSGDVLSKSYGIIAFRPNDKGGQDEVVYNLLLKNQSVNIAKHTHIFKTQFKNQRTIKFRVAESEIGCWVNSKAENLEIGKEDTQDRIDLYDEYIVKIIQDAEMILPPDLDAGEGVEVTFYVDPTDMVLNVTAVLLKTGETIEIRCDNVGIEIPEPIGNGIVI